LRARGEHLSDATGDQRAPPRVAAKRGQRAGCQRDRADALRDRDLDELVDADAHDRGIDAERARARVLRGRRAREQCSDERRIVGGDGGELLDRAPGCDHRLQLRGDRRIGRDLDPVRAHAIEQTLLELSRR
jgi:hypothetical protein